jgi:hypothetical protein
VQTAVGAVARLIEVFGDMSEELSAGDVFTH